LPSGRGLLSQLGKEGRKGSADGGQERRISSGQGARGKASGRRAFVHFLPLTGIRTLNLAQVSLAGNPLPVIRGGLLGLTPNYASRWPLHAVFANESGRTTKGAHAREIPSTERAVSSWPYPQIDNPPSSSSRAEKGFVSAARPVSSEQSSPSFFPAPNFGASHPPPVGTNQQPARGNSTRDWSPWVPAAPREADEAKEAKGRLIVTRSREPRARCARRSTLVEAGTPGTHPWALLNPPNRQYNNHAFGLARNFLEEEALPLIGPN
jgi:hypothetical protein